MKVYLNKIYDVIKNQIVSDLRYSQDIFEDILNEKVSNECVWLDSGCGHQLLSEWRLDEERRLIKKAQQIVGLDFDFFSLKKHKTIKNLVQAVMDELPFPDDYFNLVTSNMVVEHLDNPEIQFAEVSRVLSEDGLFIFHTVNEKSHFTFLRKLINGNTAKRLAYFLDDRDSDDVFEVHYKANTSEKIRELADETDFEVVEIKMISSDAVFAMVPPFAIIELVWIKLLMRKSLEKFRTNMIAILKKKENKLESKRRVDSASQDGFWKAAKQKK